MSLTRTRACKLLLASACLHLLSSCVASNVQIAADVPQTDKPFADKAENFQFVIVGDRTGGHRPGVFRDAMKRVNQLQPEFVVGVGDLIEGYTEDEEVLGEEWDEFDAMVDNLDMPFFYTVGNHDMGNAVMQRIWHQRHGRDYYHFLYQDVLFISLNTEDPPILLSEETLAKTKRLEEMLLEDPQAVRRMLRERRQSTGAGEEQPTLPGSVAISDAQVAWVERVLAENSEARWTIFLMHKPAWEYDSPAFARIEQLMKDRPYTAIAGHEHYFKYSNRLDRDYITMSTTGGIWLSEGNGSFDHIAWVTMTDQGPKISNIALCGLLGTPQQISETFSAGKADDFCFHPETEAQMRRQSRAE